MAYSLPSVESMLKVLNYSYDEIIEDVYLCLTDNHIYASHIGVRQGGPCGIVL